MASYWVSHAMPMPLAINLLSYWGEGGPCQSVVHCHFLGFFVVGFVEQGVSKLSEHAVHSYLSLRRSKLRAATLGW